MATRTCVFFENGTNAQFEFVLSKYQEALNAKAQSKSKSETLIKLDKWYQTELPKKIKARGKERFLTHDEIVQTIKWKLARGKFRPRLKDLVQMNTPRVVMNETKKAFRALEKKKDIEAAVAALSNLKGVGPAMASAVLAAGAPEVAPFMADEVLWAMPDIEGIDYTMKEYLKLVEKTKACVERLNSQGGSWNPHQVELAVWTHYISRDLKPEILEDMPDARSSPNKLKPVVNGSEAADEPPANGTPVTEPNNSPSSESANGSKIEDEKPVNGVNGDATHGLDDENSKDTTSSLGSEEAESTPASTSTEAKDTSESSSSSSKAASDVSAGEQQKEVAVAEENGAEEVALTNGSTQPAENGAEAESSVETESNRPNGKEEDTRSGAVENGSNGTQVNGIQTNGDSTDETAPATKLALESEEETAPATKRALESEEVQQNDAKRLKEEPTTQPIPAGGN